MTRSTRYLYAYAPDGTEVRRRTANDYSHAVIIFSAGRWQGVSFHSRRDLAEKKAEQVRRWYGLKGTVVVEVTDKRRLPARIPHDLPASEL